MSHFRVLDAVGTLIRRYETALPRAGGVAFGLHRDEAFVMGAVTAEGTPGTLMRLDLHMPGSPVLPAK